MTIVVIDFESYWDREYSLTKMSECEYILDNRFQVIMLGLKVGKQPTETYVGHEAAARALARVDWSKTALLAHNTRFDGSILAWRFGHVPRLYLDTLSMARATTHWQGVKSSLASLSTYFGLPEKGNEVALAQGLRLDDFTPEQLASYRAYCARDTESCRAIFDQLLPHFTNDELELIDIVLRMHIEPQIKLDGWVLSQHLDQVKQEKADMLAQVEATVDKEELSSNVKFAELLKSLNVDIPMKISPATGELIPALARGDRGFKELCQDSSQPPFVQALLTTRLSVKSTIEETRTANLLRLSNLTWPSGEVGLAPVPLKYSGARTHRLSGDGGTNWQNIVRGSLIRKSIQAPAGHRIIHRDASQIEARMTAWLAKCEPLLTAFREGRDVYSEFASLVYGKTVTKEDKLERFVGKTCVAAGTPVLTDIGWVPIEDVQRQYRLWDGIEWVNHDGLIAHGPRATLTLSGVSLTPDHLVWCGTRWRQASEAGSNDRFHPSVIAAVSLPSLATCSARAAACRRSWSNAIADDPSTRSIEATSRLSAVLDVTTVPSWLERRNDIGSMPKQCPTTLTVRAFSTASLRRLHDVILRQIKNINITALAELACFPNGLTTALPFFAISRPFPAGTIPRSKWIERTPMATTSRAIYGLSTGSQTSPINARPRTSTPDVSNNVSSSSKAVYDLLNAGSHNRFTILSDDGPVIIANSILGLGYGCGAEKFRHMLFIGNGGISLDVEEEVAQRIVRAYRTTYPEIPKLWKYVDQILRHLARGMIDETHLPIEIEHDALRLPSGLVIRYPELGFDDEGELCYLDARYNTRSKIYGAKGVENISQALARIIITDVAVRVKRLTGYHPFLSTHDSLDYCVPAADAAAMNKHLEFEFQVTPEWAEGLPLASEGGWGRTLLDAEKGANS
jgi:hypothetical protein